MAYKCPMRATAGFTLLELIVALAIFAVLSVMAYGGLRTVLETREQSELQAAQLTELQMAFTLLARDIEQALPRYIRDGFGDRQPPFYAPQRSSLLDEEVPLLVFTRAGWRNPGGLPRSTMQRVGYRVEDEKLLRLTWNVLDQGRDTEPEETVLLDGVNAIDIQFMDKDLAAHEQWPVADFTNALPGAAVELQLQPLPRALQLSVDLEQWGRITRLFRIAEGTNELDLLLGGQQQTPPGATPPDETETDPSEG